MPYTSPNALAENNITKLDTSAAEYVSENTANVDGVFETEEELLGMIRALVEVLPSCNLDDKEASANDNPNRIIPNLDSYKNDPRAVIQNIADDSLVLEMKKEYAGDVVTALIRMDGITVGCVGNQEDTITTAGAYKAEEFVDFCDAFNIPVLTLVNVTGFAATVEEEKTISKALAKLTNAYADATVPKVTVVMDKAYGTAYTVMNSKAIGADMSIPFGNHYEYSANYNDFGHNQNTERFFEQMDFLTPELLRVLKPGRVAAIHVKDRVLFGNATGTGMPTIEPFHADCIEHYMSHGFQYFGMITVVTDVVRENNQTYRLGWTEQCKDGTKMGVGCPEYILLFRKLPTDHSKAYADEPVTKSKDEYTRAQWQIDAHGYWRSSGDRLVSKEELENVSVDNLQRVYRQYSREHVYNYEDHVALAKELDMDGRLPATFMVVAPGSWNQLEVWDDINRMRTLNTTQSQRRATMHVCPLQLDIVERIINRYSNPGDVVYDPFGGLMTVPMMAVKMHRFGKGCELNPDYFRDGVGYLQAEENEVDSPTLFDFLDVDTKR